MRTRNLILLLLLAPAAHAADAAVPAECSMRDAAPERILNIVDPPSFFSKISADGRYIYYIANGNHILDVNNPSTLADVPGPYDPVPVPPTGPDHKVQYVTAPGDGMHFYKMSDVQDAMKSGKEADLTKSLKAAYTDSDNNSDYQSIGVLAKGDTAHPVYRMLTGGAQIIDYDTGTKPWKILRKLRPACGKKGGDLQLPMLSKDGREAAFYDPQAGVTKIMKLKDDGTCAEALNLGFATGKVEFSYDSKQIAFHVDSFSHGNVGGIFSGVSNDSTKNVYVLNIDRSGDKPKAGKLIKVTSNVQKGSGSYYPSFTEDGHLVYVHGQDDGLGNVHYSFRIVDLKKLTGADIYENSPSAPASPCAPTLAARFALGDLWGKICTKMAEPLGATDSMLWTLNLDPRACRDLVTKHWKDQQANISGDETILKTGKVSKQELGKVDLEALLAACPNEPAPKASPPATLTQVIDPSFAEKHHKRNGSETFALYCASCHSASVNRPGEKGQITASVFDYGKLDSTQAAQMLIAISNGEMPKGQVIQNREKELKPLIDSLTNIMKARGEYGDDEDDQ